MDGRERIEKRAWWLGTHEMRHPQDVPAGGGRAGHEAPSGCAGGGERNCVLWFASYVCSFPLLMTYVYKLHARWTGLFKSSWLWILLRWPQANEGGALLQFECASCMHLAVVGIQFHGNVGVGSCFLASHCWTNQSYFLFLSPRLTVFFSFDDLGFTLLIQNSDPNTIRSKIALIICSVSLASCDVCRDDCHTLTIPGL